MPVNPNKIIFLDRDGVINRDSPGYIKSWAEFEFLPGSLDALRLLNTQGFSTILVTNQSAVARNMLTREELEDMHRLMNDEILAAGGKIADIFYCPHMPGEGCDCRKPKPGMIHRAQSKYQIMIEDATMVGDSSKDILCARNAEVGRTLLVRTGNGLSAEAELSDMGITPDFIASDLLAAAHWLIDPAAHKNRS